MFDEISVIIDNEPENIKKEWDSFIKINDEKITSECKINKMKCLDNPFAMKEVAMWYSEAEFYTENKIEKNYLKWIKKVREWIEKRYVEYTPVLKMLLSWSYKMEGQIYAEKNDEESRNKAIECLEKADKLDYREKKFGDFDVEYSPNPTLVRLRSFNITSSYVRSLQYAQFVYDLSGESFEEIKAKSQMKAEDIIGDQWDKLDITSKKQLVTAIYTLKVMEEANGEMDFDYSSIVSLLSRALEYEVKIRFYKGYLEYLKDEYTPEEYLAYNDICSKSGIKSRKLIVDTEEKEDGSLNILDFHEYDEYGEKQFTLGSINYPIGFSYASNNNKIDKSFIDYCQKNLWEKYADEIKVKDWTAEICRKVSDLTETRNHASHGGYNLNKNEAIYAMNEIILIGKIIVSLLRPCKKLEK